MDTSQFKPDPDNVRPIGGVNVVVMTRLVWRKGMHLLVKLVPEVYRRFPYVHFIIGGDGPKRAALEEMRDRHHLQDRVELLGAVQHSDVPAVLTRGHIFLNTSLTEAFCIDPRGGQLRSHRRIDQSRRRTRDPTATHDPPD